MEQATAMLTDGAVSVRQATEFTGLSRTELYELMGRGELPFFKHGKRRLIPRKALVAMLAKAYECKSIGS